MEFRLDIPSIQLQAISEILPKAFCISTSISVTSSSFFSQLILKTWFGSSSRPPQHAVWTLPDIFSDAGIVFVSFFNTTLSISQVFTERPSVFLTTPPFAISSSVSQKPSFPDWFSRLFFRRKLLNMSLTFLPRDTTFGTALTPVAGAIELDPLTPSSCRHWPFAPAIMDSEQGANTSSSGLLQKHETHLLLHFPLSSS